MIRKYGMGVVAMMIALVAFAFTPKPTAHVSKGPKVLVYFDYTGLGHNDRTHYQIRTPQPVGDPCGTNAQLCGIWAENDGTGKPTLNSFNALKVAPQWNSTTNTFVLENSGFVEFKP